MSKGELYDLGVFPNESGETWAAYCARIKARTKVKPTARRAAPAPRPTAPLAHVNPLVAALAARNPAVFAMASKERPAPTMFLSGDLPPYTASGNPRDELLKLPPNVRHAATKADQREWSRLFNLYAGCADPEVALMFEPAAHDPEWGEYEARVAAWAAGR